MKFEGTVPIQAPIEKAWVGLTDPNMVSSCAPGLQSMQIVVPDKQFKVIASVGFGAVKVTFDVDVEFVEKKEPNYASVKAHGKAPGSAVDVTSDMRLTSDSPTQTTLNWTADVAVVGTIAGLANRLMGGITKSLSGQFFNCIKTKIEEAKIAA
jgi:carbon monoxide dehydrogenase subunit G